jgi:zinc/manganese transport system substrate-binding protein
MRTILSLATTTLAVGLLVGATVVVPGATGSVAATPALAPRMRVVAAENFWGSIVRQLAGDRAAVTSIIDNPATDPHEYEPKPSDARALASARYVIENGAGYDPWVQKLLDADPEASRRVLDVGAFLGVPEGGNPHQWYSPPSVDRFVQRVSHDLQRLDPNDAAYFAARAASFETRTLAPYHRIVAQIAQEYAKTPVGASESIFTPMADALGLRLLTPTSFLDAVAEGSDPTAHDKTVVDRQVQNKEIKVFVYNRQNATPDVHALVDSARAAGIPVASITETLVPVRATFQTWQVDQLRALRRALARAVPTS